MKLALGVQDLHVSEIRNQVLKQLKKIQRQDWMENFNSYISKSEGTTASSTRPTRKKEFFSKNIIRTTNTSNNLFTNKEAKFVIKPKLLQVLRTECEGDYKTRIVFKYEEIIALLSKYIMKRKNTLFDHRK